jgi:hypothetical protein
MASWCWLHSREEMERMRVREFGCPEMDILVTGTISAHCHFDLPMFCLQNHDNNIILSTLHAIHGLFDDSCRSHDDWFLLRKGRRGERSKKEKKSLTIKVRTSI